ncbi:PKD domain-containing protein [Oryzobacter terrae]|uniref:PKD domain-containing protein n=1 Tax=Oryzobacter terrae TaxID=1620385 RepID=UPI00366DF03E
MNAHLIPRVGRLALAALVVTLGLVVPLAPAASADEPVAVDTVGADALPTWQINGVVWSQAVVGTTVYVTGSFTRARPPGVPVGGAGEIAAQNIFAYDVTTGNPVGNFSHALNAQGLVVRASADGSRVYVGGDFTTVDGIARGHVAAFSTATGALLNWAPNIGGQVRALAVAADTVYVGGNFPSANGATRTHLAAFRVSNAQMTDWAPVAAGTGGYVWTMVMSPDQTQVIAGGSFATLNGTAAYGMGALDAATGATRPWAAQTKIRTAGLNGGITSLKADATNVYGSGYAFGSGASFEGTFAADPNGGAIRWVNDCLGDTYDVESFQGSLYSVAHAHDCSVIDGFGDTSPRSRWQKAMASSTEATGMTTRNDAYGWDFRGYAFAGLRQWYPDLEFGSYTPDRQAAWAVEGSGDYLVLGGEFPTVNGTAQQGLVRFLKKSVGPHSFKPIYLAGMDPVATSTEAGEVRVRFNSTWDRDDETLTYDVYRDNGPSIGSVTSSSVWWKLPPLVFTDTGRTPGASHTYRVRVKDATGNVQWSNKSAAVTVSSTTPSAYSALVRGDGAQHLWRFENGTSPSLDAAGATDLTLASTSTTTGVAGGALQSSGGSNPKAYAAFAEPKPAAVTLEAWVKTTSSRGGRIIGLGSSSSNSSSSYDLALYLGDNGRVNLGVKNAANSLVTTTSAQSVNDGAWHHVAAVVDAGGSTIVIDGRRAGRSQTATGGPAFRGYWRVLGDSTSGLGNRPTDAALSGAVDEVAVYTSALPIQTLRTHYTAVTGTDPTPAAQTDTYGARVQADGPDAYWRLGEASGSLARDSSGSANDATYAGVSAYGRPGAVGGSNTAVTLNGTSGSVVSQQAWGAPTTYSTEMWFQTTTTRGGRLVGFGSSGTSALSSNYDRMVCMRNDGKLMFGVSSNGQQTIVSPAAYNDGAWHHVVATQGADGMRLYVDGVERGTNPTTTAASYTGYWRAGGDRCWAGTTSTYLAGTIDDVAVYTTAIPASVVGAHYTASGRAMANQAPTSRIVSSSAFLTASLDGSTSSDPDGTIASYAWTFGDGSTSTAMAPTHVYAAAGTYPVTLTVTDDRGATAISSTSVTVVANQAPTASFTATPTGLSAAVDASASSDPDGSVASYAWAFGDGSTGTGRTTSHAYATEGPYTITLTVTDDQGTTASTTRSVTVTRPANVLPTAAFTSSSDFLTASVDGTGSTDPDGSVASYAWDFGDGGNGTGATASHTYATAGTYDVTLTVTDDRGGSATLTKPVTVAANAAPQARFTSSVDRLVVGLDASTSSDAEGAIASYAWDFGDGTNGTGRTTSHTYAADGTYTVRLTVTDGLGATDSTTASVTVVGDPSAARDAFGRTVTGGWGAADKGGAWTLSGTLSRYSVAGGLGTVNLGVGASATARLTSVAIQDTEITTTVTTDKAPTGGGQYVSVIARSVAGGSEYRGKLLLGSTGAVTAYVTRVDAGVETALGSATVTGVTYTPGTVLKVRVQATGTSPTTVRLKVWTGATEPTAWLLSRTDSTAVLQAAGSVGFYDYVSGSATNAPVVFRHDDLWVGPPQP